MNWADAHPEHDRTDCSDRNTLNADPEGSTGCARCTALLMDAAADTRAKALEEAAKICDETGDQIWSDYKQKYHVSCETAQGGEEAAYACAAAIREAIKNA